MKKPTRKKSHSANKTKIAIAATILAIPLFSLPRTGFAEVDYFLKLQSKDKFSIAGSSGGHTVYKNTEGKFFYLDPNGDMKFIAFDPYLKVGSKLKKAPTTSNAAANLHIKMTDVLVSSYSIVGLGDGHTIYKNAKGESFYLDPANGDMKFLADEWIPIKGRDIDIKGQSNVSILGVDAKGNTVNENSRGEKFYLDALTGDMVFVDGSGLTPFHAASPESSGAPGVSGKPDTRPPVGPASEAKVVLHDISITKRGTAPRPSGISDQAHTGDEDAGQAPGISLNFAEIKTDYSSAPKKDGAGKLPGITVTGVDDLSADGNQPYKTAPRQAGGGVKPGTAVTGVDDAAADGPQTYRAAPTPNSEDVKAAMVRNPEPFNDPKSNSAKAATGYKEVGSAKHSEYEEVSPGTARARAPNVSPTTKVLSGEQQGSAKGVAQGSAKGVAQGSAKGAAQGSSKGVAQGGAMRLVVTDGDIETGVATRQSGGGETALGGPDTASRIPPKSSEGKPTSAAGFAPLRPAEFKNASTLPKGEGNQLPGSVEQRGRVQLDADSNEQTTRSARGGGDVAMEELRNAGTPPNNGDETLPGIQGIPVGLEGDPGSVRVSVKTDKGGAFSFSNLPEGKYKLKLSGVPDQSLTVGDKGAISGKVMRSSDGFIRIWDDTDIVHSTAISQTISYTGLERTAPSPRAGKLPGIGVTGVDDKVADGSQRNKTASGPDIGDVELPSKKHHYKGVVTLVRGVPPPGSDLPTTNNPIPGVDFIVKKNPGGIPVSAPPPSDWDGDGRTRTSTITVNPVNDPPGKADTGYKEMGSAKQSEYEEVSPGTARARAPNVSPTTKVLSGEQQGSAKGAAQGSAKGARMSANEASANGALKNANTLPGEDGTLPGIIRVINNSETETDSVEAINGIGGTGGGRFTFKPTSRAADSANVETSNRDHIDQDAQTDIKKRTDVQSGGPGDARIRISADVSTLRGTGPGGRDGQRQDLADQPIAGLNVKLGKNPGGSIEVNATVNSSGAVLAAETMFSSRTDSQGNFHFEQLPAGNYKLILPDLPSLSLTVSDDGIAGGKVMRGPDGSVNIFDRRGNLYTAPTPKTGNAKSDNDDRKNGDNPVAGFGTGMNAGPPMNPGGPMTPGGPMGPGGPMNPGGPMSPGAGPMGPGGPMGGGMRP